MLAVMRRFALAAAAWLALVAAAGDDTTRTSSVFAPISTPADASYTVATLVLSITAAIAIVVLGLLAYAIVAFRVQPDDDGSEPAQVYGSDQIELAWTVIHLAFLRAAGSRLVVLAQWVWTYLTKQFGSRVIFEGQGGAES